MPFTPLIDPDLADVFRDAVTGMLVLDLDGRVLQANAAALGLLGHGDASPPADIRAFTHADDLPAQFARMQELQAGARASFQMDKRCLRPDGTLVPVRLSMALLRDAGGTAYGFLSQIEDLSARRKAEEARDAFFEMSPDLLAIAGTDGRLHEVNPAWKALLGWSAAELRARPFVDFVHPDDVERTRAEAAQLYAGRGTASFRNRYRTRGGEYRWLEWNTRLAGDGRLYCAARDVTAEEQTRRERDDVASRQAAELASAQRQLELHAGNSPLALIEWDASGRITRWSPRAQALFGWSEAEALGRRPQDWGFVHEDDLDAVMQVIEAMAAGNPPHLIASNRNYTRDGAVLHCEWFNSALYDADGRLVSVLSQVQDTTAHAQALQALRESERRFRATFEQAAVGIAHVGLDGRWLRVNSALCRLLGYDEAELLATTFQQLTHPDDLDKDLELVAQVLDGRIEHYAMEKRYLHRDGHPLWARLTVSLVREADGRPLKFVSVVEDIGAAKAADAALHEAHEQLERRVQLRTADLQRTNAELSREVAQRRQAETALRDSELRLRSILENSHDAFLAVDEDGRLVEWNRAAEITFGWERDVVIGRPAAEVVVPPMLQPAYAQRLAQFIRGEGAGTSGRRVHLRLLHRHGHEFPVEMTLSEVQLRGRRLFTAFLHDIGERKAAEQRLRENEARLRLVTDNVPALIAYIDRDLRYGFNNATYRSWFGQNPATLVGRRMDEVIGADAFATVQSFVQRVLGGERVQFDLALPAGDGVRHVHATYLPDHDERGAVRGFYVLANDVTAHHALTSMLRERALRDELTGLPNRAAWTEQFERGLSRAQRSGAPAVVMFLDLDGFKQVNDRHGHEAGDALLREFAARLGANLRRADTVARLGGDEFVVLLENIKDPHRDPATIARKLLEAMVPTVAFGGAELRISTSIGIAIQRTGAFDAEQLMREADQAMYRSKRAGASGFALVELSPGEWSVSRDSD